MILVKDNNPKWVTPDKVKDGQLCIIRKHPLQENVGNILHRYINTFITIGERAGKCYTTLHHSPQELCLVEILEKGTLLEL